MVVLLLGNRRDPACWKRLQTVACAMGAEVGSRNLIIDILSASYGAAFGWCIYRLAMKGSSGRYYHPFWFKGGSQVYEFLCKAVTQHPPNVAADCPHDLHLERRDNKETKGAEEEKQEEKAHLIERILVLEEENRALCELNSSLALENRQLSERIIQVAFVDGDDMDVGSCPSAVTSTECDCSWWLPWEDAADDVYKTPEKSVRTRQMNDTRILSVKMEDHQLQTPPLHADKSVNKV